MIRLSVDDLGFRSSRDTMSRVLCHVSAIFGRGTGAGSHVSLYCAYRIYSSPLVEMSSVKGWSIVMDGTNVPYQYPLVGEKCWVASDQVVMAARPLVLGLTAQHRFLLCLAAIPLLLGRGTGGMKTVTALYFSYY